MMERRGWFLPLLCVFLVMDGSFMSMANATQLGASAGNESLRLRVESIIGKLAHSIHDKLDAKSKSAVVRIHQKLLGLDETTLLQYRAKKTDNLKPQVGSASTNSIATKQTELPSKGIPQSAPSHPSQVLATNKQFGNMNFPDGGPSMDSDPTSFTTPSGGDAAAAGAGGGSGTSGFGNFGGPSGGADGPSLDESSFANGPNFGGGGGGDSGDAPSFGSNGPSFGGDGPSFGGGGDSGDAPSFGSNAPNFGSNAPNFGSNAPNFGTDGPSSGEEMPPDAEGPFGQLGSDESASSPFDNFHPSGEEGGDAEMPPGFDGPDSHGGSTIGSFGGGGGGMGGGEAGGSSGGEEWGPDEVNQVDTADMMKSFGFPLDDPNFVDDVAAEQQNSGGGGGGGGGGSSSGTSRGTGSSGASANKAPAAPPHARSPATVKPSSPPPKKGSAGLTIFARVISIFGFLFGVIVLLFYLKTVGGRVEEATKKKADGDKKESS